MVNDWELILKMLNKISIELSSLELEESGKKLIKIILSKWINASDALLEMIVLHLPSP